MIAFNTEIQQHLHIQPFVVCDCPAVWQHCQIVTGVKAHCPDADGGRISELILHTDALDTQLVTALTEALPGTQLTKAAVAEAFRQIPAQNRLQASMKDDLERLLGLLL